MNVSLTPEHLADSSRSIGEVAYMIGYSEAAAFYRRSGDGTKRRRRPIARDARSGA